MLTHVVLMKFTDPADAPEAKERLEALAGRVPQIRELSAHLDVVHSPVSYDLCLVTTHESADELRGYQQHPDHLELAGWLRPKLAARAVVDHEG
ncbi:Dabb family protein [Nonomuraea sp. NPDC049486]|uniref:Dabb family protein n=1 Tax=Nonomuraea sp. NPDC049486 TaxID=3155773 RepID=UPI003420A5FB